MTLPCSTPHLRRLKGAFAWPVSAVLVVIASGAPQEPGLQQLSGAARVPLRSEYVPPAAQGPVSLTTQLNPVEAVTPLLPDGTGDLTFEPEPIIESNKRWTFSLEVRSIYDDNIYLSAEANEQSDVVVLLTPSVTYRRGDSTGRQGSYLTAGYSPSASFFVDDNSENSLDHTVRFDGQKHFGKLTAGLEGRYQRLSGATVELSDRVDRDEAGIRARARYDFSGRTSAETSVEWNTVNYRESGLADYDEWVAETFVGYQFSGRTRVAAGGAVGRMNVDGSGSQDFIRGLVKVTTEAAGKLTLDAKGGVEYRDTDAGSHTTPVFNVTAAYRPGGRTSIGAGLYREVTASGSIEKENVTRTGAALGIQQKMGRRFTAGVEAGYEQLDYAATGAGAGAAESGREDEYFFIRPSLRYEIREGRRAEIYYSLRRDDSNLSSFDFEANQAGLGLAIEF